MAKKKTTKTAKPAPTPTPAPVVRDDPAEDSGVRCPSCGCGHCPVYYTRNRRGRRIRSRTCRNCDRRFVTTEKVNG